jgi:hypothetical protein
MASARSPGFPTDKEYGSMALGVTTPRPQVGAIQRLTRGRGLNLVGARYVINCLQLLEAHRIPRPDALAGVDIEHVKV